MQKINPCSSVGDALSHMLFLFISKPLDENESQNSQII